MYDGYASAMPLAAPAPSTGGGPPGGGGGSPPVVGPMMRPPVASSALASAQMAQPLANTQPHPPAASAQLADPRQAQHAQPPQPPPSTEPPRARPSAPSAPVTPSPTVTGAPAATNGPPMPGKGPSGIQMLGFGPPGLEPAPQAPRFPIPLDPEPPIPPLPDPKDMNPQQLNDAWKDLVADRDAYNADRCWRVFQLPAENAEYNSCLSRWRATTEREAALRQRYRDLGIPEPPPDRASGSTPQPGTPGAPSQPGTEEPPGTPGGGPQLIDEVPLHTDRTQIEAKYKHSADFGVTDPRGRAGFDNFDRTLKQFVDDPTTLHIQGTYRGQPVILNYNPDSGLCVIQNPDGSLISGWKLSPEQLRSVVNSGMLGGGD
jgi:Colicin D